MPSDNQNPFLGLKPYELADRRKLYGRDKDLFLMKDRIFSARTCLLFAGSGVGKTSFINAKLAPELQGQYTIIYHNQWAVDQPLVGLLKKIKSQLPPDEQAAQGASDPEVKKIPCFYVANSLVFYLNRFRRRATETRSRSSSRCLLVLDQFEEVFQHHAHKKYFDTFVQQLSGLINDEDCSVRVLFSMREEFLGELSIFDNQIADLFSNYYRLKSPNKQEAFDIIERTCNYVNVPVDKERLAILIDDLTKIRTTATTSNNHEPQLDVDIVAPPYLQIACQRLWDRQFNSSKDGEPPPTDDKTEENPAFLTKYVVGDARSMLKSFCEDILKAFKKHERSLLAEAFNFLVTKRGAKMAYELSSLADHMSVKEDVLKPVLHRLSDFNSRILRESNGPDQALWFELYHDMYGPIIDQWRRAYRQEERSDLRRNLATVGAVVGIVVLLLIAVNYSLNQRNERETTLRNGNLSDASSYAECKKAFDELKNFWGAEETARQLWAEAWKRRAFRAEMNEDGKDAVLSWLKAAQVAPKDHDDAALFSQISSYLNTDQYEPLLSSFQIDVGSNTSPAFAPILTSDGKMLLTITNDRRVSYFDADSFTFKSQTLQLLVEETNQPPTRPAAQEIAYQPDDFKPPDFGGPSSRTQIQAATETLIGGVNNNKFCIWEAKTGEKIWESDPQGEPNAEILLTLRRGTSSEYFGSSHEPSLTFSPDGRFFATSDQSGSVRIYKLAANQTVEPVLQDVMDSVSKMQFSPDCHSVLLVLKDGTTQLRDLDKNSSKNLGLQSTSISRITFSPNGSKFLADMGQNQPDEIWDIESASLTRKASMLAGEQFFCSDNKTVAVIQTDGYLNTTTFRITFWDVVTGSIRSTRSIKFDEITSYVINPNGASMLTVGGSGSARLWSLTPPSAPKSRITESAQIVLSDISEDGKVIVTANNDQSLSGWDAEFRKNLWRHSISEKLDPEPNDFSVPKEDFVSDLVLSPHGKYLCLVTYFGKFSVRDSQTNREVKKGNFADAFGRSFAFGPDDNAFAVADHKGIVTVWRDLQDAHPTPIKFSQMVTGLVFSPDSKYLAVISDVVRTPYVKVFDVATGTEKRLPNEGFTPILSFGRNGQIIGTLANDNKAVQVWDLNTESSLQKLPHTASVTAVALSADGKTALTSTSDGNLRLWEITSEKVIAKGPCSTRIFSLEMNNGGIVTALSETWIHIHFLESADLKYFDGRQIAALELPRILEGKKLRTIFAPVQNFLEVEDVDFDALPKSNLTAKTAAGLFDAWTKRLTVNFDVNGRITETDRK